MHRCTHTPLTLHNMVCVHVCVCVCTPLTSLKIFSKARSRSWSLVVLQKMTEMYIQMNWGKLNSDSMDVNLSQLLEIGKDREAWHAGVRGVAKSQTCLSDWTTTRNLSIIIFSVCKYSFSSAGTMPCIWEICPLGCRLAPKLVLVLMEA